MKRLLCFLLAPLALLPAPHPPPVLAGRRAGVFAKDMAEIRGRGEAARGGDIFEFAVRGA